MKMNMRLSTSRELLKEVPYANRVDYKKQLIEIHWTRIQPQEINERKKKDWANVRVYVYV